MKAAISRILKYLLVPCLLLPTTKKAVDHLWHQQWPTLPNSTQATILFLAVFLSLSGAYYATILGWQVYTLRRENPQIIRERYAFDPKTKIRTRRGIRYCNRCLLSPECLPSPLAVSETQGLWMCDNKNCGQPYYDETFVPPPEEPPPKPGLARRW